MGSARQGWAHDFTHCNAGSLATAGYGTALGVIRAAHEQGKKISVIADETRPVSKISIDCMGTDARSDTSYAYYR